MRDNIEHKKHMYLICFSVLAICLVLLSVVGKQQISLFKDSLINDAVVSETKNLTLTIAEERPYISYENISFENITRETALNAILQAEKDMQEMQEAGFAVVWVNDTLIEAKKYFEGENYTALLEDIRKISDLERREKARALLIEAQKKIGVPVDYKKVLEKTKAISERKKKTYEISDYLRASELRIKEIGETLARELSSSIFKDLITGAVAAETGNLTPAGGLDMTAASELLDKAKIEFKEERYDDATALLAEIEPKIDEIRSENTLFKTVYKAGKETTINFIKENYLAIIITSVIVIILFLLSFKRIMVTILKRKLQDMNVEKDVLTELMKKSQSDYYSKGAIPKQTYEIKISKYKERMLQIKQQLPVIQARLEKLAKIKR